MALIFSLNAPAYILNHQAVVDFYGYWRSFHDAQVLSYVAPASDTQSLSLTLHTWQMTDQVDAKGFFILQKHALVSFRFDGVHNAKLDTFRSGNILYGMEFSLGSDAPAFRVVLDSVMGMSGSFSARGGEVVSVVPCGPDGP